MFATDITLAGTSTSKTYSLVSIVEGKALRKDATAEAQAPRTMVISHQSVKRNGYTADRHLVRLDDSFNVPVGTGTDSIDVLGSVQIVIEMPRTYVTAAQIKDVLDRMLTLLGSSTNVDKLLNSEP
jgi:hypothetical protein